MPEQTPGIQMPIANKQAAKRAKAGGAIQLQQQLKAAGSKPIAPGAPQQMAAGFTGQQAQADVAGQAAGAAQTAQTAQSQFQQSQLQSSEENLNKDKQLNDTRAETEKRLAASGRDVADKLLNKTLGFNEKTRKAKFANERQMADYIALHAKDEQDFLNKAQEMQQASAMKIHAMEQANSVMLRKMKQDFQSGEAEKDREAQARIAAAQAALQDKINKEKKKAGTFKKVVGVAKIAAGVAIGVSTSWTGVGAVAGASIASQGASELA